MRRLLKLLFRFISDNIIDITIISLYSPPTDETIANELKELILSKEFKVKG